MRYNLLLTPKSEGEKVNSLFFKSDGSPVYHPFLNRTLKITGSISEEMADDFYENILYLIGKDPGEPINVLINTYGGSARGLMLIYEAMKLAKERCVVKTICLAKAYSAGSLILASGSTGHRYIFPTAEVLVHNLQLDLNTSGERKFHIVPMIENIEEMERKVRKMYIEELGKKITKNGKVIGPNKRERAKLEKFLDSFHGQDLRLTAEEAVEHGFADTIGRVLIPVDSAILMREQADEIKDFFTIAQATADVTDEILEISTREDQEETRQNVSKKELEEYEEQEEEYEEYEGDDDGDYQIVTRFNNGETKNGKNKKKSVQNKSRKLSNGNVQKSISVQMSEWKKRNVLQGFGVY